jgi:hypothetical protein
MHVTRRQTHVSALIIIAVVICSAASAIMQAGGDGARMHGVLFGQVTPEPVVWDSRGGLLRAMVGWQDAGGVLELQ